MTAIDLKPYSSKILHLKSAISMYGYNKIIVGDTIGKEIANIIDILSPKLYEFCYVPDFPASNVIFVNDCLITRCSSEFPRSIEIIKDKVGKGNIIQWSTHVLFSII